MNLQFHQVNQSINKEKIKLGKLGNLIPIEGKLPPNCSTSTSIPPPPPPPPPHPKFQLPLQIKLKIKNFFLQCIPQKWMWLKKGVKYVIWS